MSEYDGETGITFAPRKEDPDDDKGLMVEFYMRPISNAVRSNTEGRPIFDQVEYVRISAVGQRNMEVDERVNDTHRRRFANRYARFKSGSEPAGEGTPLEEWPPMTVAQIAELRSLKIRTVEQLANVGDSHLNNLGTGGRQLRDKARAFIQGDGGAAALAEALARATKAEERADQSDALIRQMQQEIIKIQARVDATGGTSQAGVPDYAAAQQAGQFGGS